MKSGQNLPFCAADSNKYIGRIQPHVIGSSFFSPVFAFKFRNSHFSRKLHICQNIYVVNYIGRESCPVKFAFTMRTSMPSKREETVERIWEKRDRRAEKVKGGIVDQRGQKKAKTPRKMTEVRTPAGK